MKILMVCLGNICRSPLAEGIMQHKINEQGLKWEVDSAGTGSWHVGELPDRRSIAIGRKYGVDITYQRARQFKPHDLENFDLVLAMDSSNYQDIIRHAVSKEQAEKVHLIMNFVSPGRNEAVPDPYWDDDGFEQVFRMLDEACDRIIEHYEVRV
ncbi:MAG: low molecular weight phosphotyrosine protein phosphatase [Lewinellaceae bacterium]|nr:low molecular weight phosphotyrosine protein phosphatase [Saprospiraceae bacterium]MCB9337681.1 low molecular weight phosphotyrosine protein phosphatase [Lewinellaceae bacterium]